MLGINDSISDYNVLRSMGKCFFQYQLNDSSFVQTFVINSMNERYIEQVVEIPIDNQWVNNVINPPFYGEYSVTASKLEPIDSYSMDIEGVGGINLNDTVYINGLTSLSFNARNREVIRIHYGARDLKEISPYFIRIFEVSKGKQKVVEIHLKKH